MRWIVLLLLASAVLFAVWRFASSVGGPDLGAPEVLGPAARTVGREEGPAPGAVSRAGAPARGTSSDEGSRQREVVTAPRRVERDGDFSVLVVLAETGEPLRDAQVTFLDRRANPEWGAAWSEPTTRLQFIRTHGRSLTADGQGLLQVPRTDSGALSLRLAGYYGEVEWDGPPQDGLRLEAHADLDLRVRVLDERGMPRTGVPVVLLRDQGGAAVPLISRQTVGQEAIAAFPRVRQLLGAGSATGTHFLSLGFPCLDPPRVVLDPRTPPTGIVDLRMPATGRLVVRVMDERGQPLATIANVTLGATLDASGRPVVQGAMTQRVVGGRASFQFVGVGARFQVRLDGASDRPPLSEDHTGPDRPGQEKEIVLTWAERHPVVVGRAVDTTGAPLVARRGRYFVRSGQRVNPGPVFSTDGSGRFRAVVDMPLAEDRTRSVQATIYTAANHAPLEATMELGFDLEAGDIELGDVTFVPAQAVASGRVTDRSGSPLYGVHVRGEVQGEGGDFSPQRDLATSTDQEGAFALFGRVDGANLRLVVQRQGFLEHRTRPLVVGTANLEIALDSVR